MKKTACLEVLHNHLLIPIIWEGDLRLHTDKVHMKNSLFKQNIIHGDTTINLTVHLIRTHLRQPIQIVTMKNKFLKAVYIEDEIYVEYLLEASTVLYTTFNQHGEQVLEGELIYAEK